MRFVPFLLLSLALTCSIAGAEIYKWVDANGTVRFTDTPPPKEVKSEIVNPQPNTIEGYGRTSEKATVTEKSQAAAAAVPVVDNNDLPIVEMFVTSWCGYCKKAEAWFEARNIPYVKYDIEKDRQAAERKATLTQSRGVPFVLIGDVGIPGYSEAAFERALRQYR